MPFLPTDAFPVDLLPSGDVEPLADVVWTGTHEDSVTIRARRRSNLGNVPKLLRGVLPHDGKAARGFLVHDELCELQHEHQRALDAWEAAYGAIERRNQAVERAMRGHWTVLPSRPEPPPFDAVDTDAVMRVVLAELGVGPVRWIYWEGVRLGALGSKARRRGFLRPRSVVPFVLLAVPSLVVVLPAALGALVSRALLALVELLAWPWERRARAKRAATVRRVRRVARGRATIARGAARARLLSVQDLTAGLTLTVSRAMVDGETPEQAEIRAHWEALHGRRAAAGDPDDGERPTLTGTALAAAERDYLGSDGTDWPGPEVAQAFRAGWRRGVDRIRENAARESSESATRTENGEARRAAAMKAGQFIDCGALIAPLDPGPCADCRNGCPVVGGPCSPVGLAIARRQAETRDCQCPDGNEAPAGGDCQHPTCPRDETPGGTL